MSGVEIRIGADDSDFQAALNRSKAGLQDFGAKARENATEVAKWGAAAAAAGVAVGAALVARSIQAAREIDNLSRVANTSTARFRAMAFGARSVGIEQDKLADILKDVNDRVGDFLTTGGGPMADFFERIAPQVGVTAEQFRNLSGPDALQLYVDSLQKANLSQAEMTFFMEAMASDATALIPLLKDGGAAMAEQARQAEKLGLVLSDIETEQLKQSGQAMQEAASITSAFVDQLSAELAPIITEITKLFKEQALEAGGVGEMATDAFNNIIDAAGFVYDAVEGIKRVFQITADLIIGNWSTVTATVAGGIETLLRAADALPLIDLSQQIAEVERFSNEAESVAQQAYDNIAKTLNAPMPSESFKKFVADVKEASQEATAAIVETRNQALGGGDGGGGGMESAETIKLKEDLQARIEAIQEAQLTERELQLAKYAQENEDLALALENKLLTEDQYLRLMQDNRAKHEKTISDIEKRAADARNAAEEKAQKEKLAVYQGALSSLSALMNSESRKQFEIGKAAGIANSIVSTYTGMSKALELPFPLNLAAAAAVAVQGFSQVQSIRSQTFNGGGGSAAAAGGAAGATAAISNTQAVNAQTEPVQTRSTSIDIALLGADSRDRAVAGSIIEQINQEIEGGGRISRIGLA